MAIQMPKIQVYTTKHLYHRVTQWLSELKIQNPQIETVLDAPAGAGALTQFLSEELGLKAQAIEIDRSKWSYPLVEPILTDLGRPLPFESNSFDWSFAWKDLNTSPMSQQPSLNSREFCGLEGFSS